MGGRSGGTQIYTPQAPTPPSYQSTIEDYVKSLPALYEAQMKYAPLEAQQQLSLLQQYGGQMAKSYKDIQEVLYPGAAGLQEQLAGLVKQNISGGVPDALKDQYQSNLKAQLGENAMSGIGADYVSRGLIDQQQQYNQYYQQLGLSLAGLQPTFSGQMPAYTSQLAQTNPGAASNFAQGNYGIFAGASKPMGIQGGTPNWALGLNAAGNLLGGIGAMKCWVAAACFGGWNNPKTHYARYFISNFMPKWFIDLYTEYGERLSKNKLAVFLLKPLFIFFAWRGEREYANSMV